MFVTYTPAGETPREWVFKPGDMLNRESEQIEKVTGLTWEEFLQQLQKGLTMARRALLWTLLRRDHPVLRFSDIEFRQGELAVDYDRGELEEMRAGLLEPGAQARAEKSGQDLDAMLAAVEAQMEKAREDPAPKAPANSNVSATSTPSPSPDATPSPAEN
jgi:hypothetical protein